MSVTGKEHDTDGVGAKNRGRSADHPGEIPPVGWRDILLRVKEQLGTDNISVVSAGVAFYAFMALFPALIATIMIYGLLVDPSTVEQQLASLTDILPPQARELIGEQLNTIAGHSESSLSLGAFISLALAIWSANKGMKMLFTGICIAYDEIEERGFLKLNGITLLFTVGGIFMTIICASLIVAGPVALGKMNLPFVLEITARVGRWLILLFFILGALALLYKYGPDRATPELRWVSGGAVVAAFLWLLGSWVFSFYVSNFGNYNATYGSVAAVVVIMLWFLLTSFFILLGAEINSEMEGQTRKDSTTGKDRPMGERGAYHADNVGRVP